MDELYKHLNYGSSDYDPEWTELVIANKVRPQDYLNYARKDALANNSDRANVNAYTNAKRALHFQVDLLLEAFGLNKKGSLSFPKKIELCERCGIATPKILKKINLLRNKVEHDYFIPEKNEVEDAIDVVELFLASTQRFFDRFPDNVVFPEMDAVIFNCTGIFNVRLVKNKGEIILSLMDKEENYTSVSYLAPSREFFAWLYFINHSSK